MDSDLLASLLPLSASEEYVLFHIHSTLREFNQESNEKGEGFHIPENKIDQLILKIFTFYGERQRSYHTLYHIDELLHLYDKYLSDKEGFLLRDRIVLYCAILFHDIVYNPQSKTNEEDSVEIMKSHFDPYLSIELVSQIEEFIICTKAHRLPPDTTDLPNNTLKLFLDFDLLILAAPAQRYNEYMKQIRLEYHHVAERDYVKGRGEVLKSFLRRDSLYFTPSIQEEYEPIARENIAKEMEELEKTLVTLNDLNLGLEY